MKLLTILFFIEIINSQYPRDLTQRQTLIPMFNKIESGHSFGHINSALKNLTNFKNRNAYSSVGEEASKWLKNEYEKRLNGLPVERRNLITIREYVHTGGFKQNSLIITFRGRSTKTVILGAHFDRFNISNK
jgi:hypothetical protein